MLTNFEFAMLDSRVIATRANPSVRTIHGQAIFEKPNFEPGCA